MAFIIWHCTIQYSFICQKWLFLLSWPVIFWCSFGTNSLLFVIVVSDFSEKAPDNHLGKLRQLYATAKDLSENEVRCVKNDESWLSISLWCSDFSFYWIKCSVVPFFLFWLCCCLFHEINLLMSQLFRQDHSLDHKY